MATALPYINGMTPDGKTPLARYLPPVPNGVVSAWLEKNVSKGDWVIDPFGASPRLVIEAARAGYRVLVSINNPVTRFLLEISANRPSHAELRAALSELASAHHGDGRIEPYIRSLYQTNCAACGQSIMADAFLWERGVAAPYARIYHCPLCDDEGEHPVNENDIRLAAQFAAGGPHRARALERVALSGDPDRIHVEEALSHYLPRAVFVLFTLINRLDGLNISPARRRYLQALLLHACDMGNTLWAVPTSRPRPRQLATPPRFRENNIWSALEQGIEVCGDEISAQGVTLVNWPDEPPPEGGICLFEGRLRELSIYLEKQHIQAVVAAIPRHNQAFWTLSALWAGWLWGREAVTPFKMVLRRRWYDWAWHTTALYMTLQHLAATLQPGIPFFGLLSEAEAGFLTASVTAADAAGFSLEGLALREDQAHVQLLWNQNLQIAATYNSPSIDQVASEAMHGYLSERGEPASYLLTLTAGLQAIAEHRIQWMAMNPGGQATELDETGEGEREAEGGDQPVPARPHYLYTTTNVAIRKALTNRSEFTNYHVGEKADTPEVVDKMRSTEPEVGQYWLYAAGYTNLSLADRVEITLVRYLTKHKECSYTELQESLYESFPGLFTPDDDLLRTCLESYGELASEGENNWRLRDPDRPAQRRQDLKEVQGIITKIGERLGLQVQERPIATQQERTAIAWLDSNDQPLYMFFPIVSAVISDILMQDDLAESKNIVVLPGSRANLVAYKLNRDPRLSERCEPPDGWQFLKFRHLRWHLENPLLSLISLAESLELDPLTYSTPQLRLL